METIFVVGKKQLVKEVTTTTNNNNNRKKNYDFLLAKITKKTIITVKRLAKDYHGDDRLNHLLPHPTHHWTLKPPDNHVASRITRPITTPQGPRR